ncbi:conserved hypothetical protein [Mucor ambiguus]|uniref:Pentacotripeptide-repeat region of PRORP domain-containing protein n=1 Tax=Mucor ambiguus TaxID=91626 RepID=A0A0C9MDH4_9FUNG|nr:conserved hypothetical protein [Mucor ambiguus]
MLSRANLLRGSYVLNRQSPLLNTLTRAFASRGLQEERTKQVIEEIKKLEYQLESKSKQKSASFDKVDEEDIASIYKELAAPIPVKPKISNDYLEKLRIKFLDTRQQQQQIEGDQQAALSAQLPSEASVEASKDVPATTTTAESVQSLSVQDFEQLIYANALAKRPVEAEKAFDLMTSYNITPSLRSVNHLMDAYASANNVEQTVATFKRLDQLGMQPDIYTYGTLVKAFVTNKRLDDAFVIFEKMKHASIIPSQPIFSNLISGCLKANKVEKAWEVFDSMRLSYHQPDEVSFTLMLHACAKRGEVERALNLFEDMAGYQLYPTDVTFNVLINACAKRPDYYNEAFSLLDQMQTSYGFQPDKITYNTLLTACARKKDLKQARLILQTMWQDVEKNGSESLLKPDSTTYTNLFWCYASYHPTAASQNQNQQNSKTASTTALSTERNLLPANVPSKRSLVVKEAEWLFKQIQQDVEITPALLTSYLTLHISQKQTSKCEAIYTKLFDQHGVEKNAFTYQKMLQLCYNTKDKTLAWKVWEDYQDFLESRAKQFDETPASSEIERKAMEAEKNAIAIKEGWKGHHQQHMAVLMANTLARSNDTKNALSILTSELRRSSSIGAPRLREMMPVYNKCIQLEDEQTKKELVRICIQDLKRPGNSKYKRVNRTD